MSIVARCGSVVLLTGLLALGAVASAQSPAGSSGSWTDPPTRGAAGPGDASTGDAKAGDAKTGGAKPIGPTVRSSSAPEKPTRNAAAPSEKRAVQKAASARANPVLRPMPQTRRALAFRRYPVPIRRLAARTPALAAAQSSWGHRLRLAAQPHRHVATRHTRRVAPAYAYAEPYRRFAEPPAYARRAGWSGLLNDERAYRVAQARAAGYRVMRLRTYEFPGGGRVERLLPYDPGDLD